MFLVALLVTAAAAAAAVLFAKWRRVRSYWEARGVLSRPPHPLFGSLTFLRRRNIIEWMLEQYAHHKDQPYFGMWVFWRPVLVVRSPELAKRILVKDFDNFRNRLLRSGKTDPLGGLNVFTVMEPTWSAVRRPLTAFFSSAKLKALHPLNLKISRDLVQRIRDDLARGSSTHLRELFTCYTTDVISAAAFGVGGEATLTNQSPMREVTRDMAEFGLWRSLSWSSIFFWPELVDVFRFKMFSKSSMKYFRKIFRQVMAAREGESSVEHRDLLGILMKMKKDAAEDGQELSEDLLLAQAAIMLLGGFDTTAIASSWTMYETAFSPDVQERLYQEIVATKRDVLKGEDFNSSVLKDMPYLNAVINEGARKYPPMGWLDRIAAKDYKIDDNLTISAGTPVYILGGGMHYDPEYFPDPHAFNPDRWLPENAGKIVPFTYMPFGEGPRQCIGERLGKQSMRYIVATVVEKFLMVPCAGAPRPADIKLDCKGIFMMPGEELRVDFVPRG